MHYIFNSHFETMDTTEEGLILLDPATGNVHMLDEVGASICSLLKQEHTSSSLIEALCQIYEASPEEITEDVQVFLEDAHGKGLVLRYAH